LTSQTNTAVFVSLFVLFVSWKCTEPEQYSAYEQDLPPRVKQATPTFFLSSHEPTLVTNENI